MCFKNTPAGTKLFLLDSMCTEKKKKKVLIFKNNLLALNEENILE